MNTFIFDFSKERNILGKNRKILIDLARDAVYLSLPVRLIESTKILSEVQPGWQPWLLHRYIEESVVIIGPSLTNF